MIVGAAVLPTAPLLVPGLSATLPAGVEKVSDCIDAAVEALPSCDVVIAIAAGQAAVYRTGAVDFAGVGRPDITAQYEVATGAAEHLADTAGYPLVENGHLPLDLAVLAVHLGDVAPLVPIAVPPDASAEELTAIGEGFAEDSSGEDVRVAVVAAGDLSAGLTEKSPMHLVSGAIFFDEQAVAALDGGRLRGLVRLGPGEAQRVGSRGWAPLMVLGAILERARMGMVVRHYSAPRGVGYVVASGS